MLEDIEPTNAFSGHRDLRVGPMTVFGGIPGMSFGPVPRRPLHGASRNAVGGSGVVGAATVRPMQPGKWL